MANIFIFKSVDGNPTSEGVHIWICGTAHECPRNQNTYKMVHNKMLFLLDEFDHTVLNPYHIHNYDILF